MNHRQYLAFLIAHHAMKMTTVSHCKTNLEFGPITAWPEVLPAFAWAGELLCDFEARPLKSVVELDCEDPLELAPIFFALYPTLTLPELARLWNRVQLLPPLAHSDFFAQLLQCYQMRFSESLVELLQKLARTPQGFQVWASEHRLGAKELSILKSVSGDDVSTLVEFFSEFCTMKPSRTQGAQLLETALELHLMGTSAILPVDDEKLEAWSQRLWNLRHPRAGEQAAAKATVLENLGLPKYLEARVVRRGAELGHEIKFHFKSAAELEKNLAALSKLRSQLEVKPNA